MPNLPRILTTLLFSAGLACLWLSAQPPEQVLQPEVPTQQVSFESYHVEQQAIQTIQVGQRVWIGENPSEERDLRYGEEIDHPMQWRKMVLLCQKVDGTTAKVEMLRPATWLEEQQVHVGGKVPIEVPECGIEGLADVLDIQPCPPIDQGPGRTVTATFHHQSATTYDLQIEGFDQPIGTTGNHPFWSETKQEFVRADELSAGEEVLTNNGVAFVASLSPRGPPEPVFNLEVQLEHDYRVGDAGVLVHNGDPDCNLISLESVEESAKPYRKKAPTGANQLDRLQNAKREFQKNRNFKNWFHKEYKEDLGFGGGGRNNPDLPIEDIADALDEWVDLGKPKL